MDEQQLTEVENLVGSFLEVLEYSAEIDSRYSEEGDRKLVHVHIQGENVSELIGYHGKNLESLQRLVGIAYNRGKEEYINILLDINEYRKKREEYLTSVADMALLQVRESNQVMTLPPMKASERRIVHMVLKKEDGITTESEGVEPNRSIVISPV